MLKKSKQFTCKLAFITREIYKSGPGSMLLSILSVIISGLSPVVTTYATANVINLLEQDVYPVNLKSKLVSLITLIILMVLVNIFINNIKYTIFETSSYRLSHNIENIIADKFQKIPLYEMDNPDFLDLYKNATRQAGNAPMNIFYSLFGIVSAGIELFGYLIILFQLSLLSIPLFVVFAIPCFCLKRIVQLKEFDFFEHNTNQFRQIYYLFSLISEKQYANEVRLFNIFNFLKAKRNNIFKITMQSRNKILTTSTVYTAIICVIAAIIIAILEFWLIKRLIEGFLPLSQFVLFNTAITATVSGLFSLIEQIVSFNRSIRFIDYLFKFLDFNPKNCNSNLNYLKLSPLDDYVIEFVDVSFKYYGASCYSLKNVNLKFKPGQKICLVGENGSGKTTLIKLLLRVYEPTSGIITLNGRNINYYDINVYRALFSTVFQDFIHYYFDVKSNIAIGNISQISNIERVKNASRKTFADNFIEKYKNVYETNLGKDFFDDAVEPSIGQWQKIAVSRAIFKEAPILILDEPTAALDPKAEEEIFKIIDNLEKNKTVLFISHRMCSAKLADEIILLEKGKIIEQGIHTDLIKQKGKYHEMYNMQAKKYSTL